MKILVSASHRPTRYKMPRQAVEPIRATMQGETPLTSTLSQCGIAQVFCYTDLQPLGRDYWLGHFSVLAG